MATNRIDREVENREFAERPKQWMPPELLPEPDKQAGYAYRWIRTSIMNDADPRNVASRFREGWEPVKLAEQPRYKLLVEQGSRFEDCIEIGGLLLCKIPEHFVEQREAYYQNANQQQIQAVDNNFMKENDPRMPLFKDSRSKVSFGKG